MSDQTRRDLAVERFAASKVWFGWSSMVVGLALALLTFAAVPTYGWTSFLAVGLVSLVGSLAQFFNTSHSARHYVVGQICFMAGIGLCVPVTGGAMSFLFVLVPPLALAFYGRLHPNMAAASAWCSVALVCTPILVIDLESVREFPWLVAGCFIGMAALAPTARQMASGELRSRGEATIDQLTGLLNRRGLDARLGELVEQAAVIGEDTPIALVACDLDHFKAVNDTHGHARGDDVLRDTAYVIRKQLRRFELAYRLGGEEFLVVLPGHNEVTAYGIAEAIRSSVERSRPGGVDMTISIGIASSSAADADPAALQRAADDALYQAKRSGRNRVVLASAAPDPTG